MAYIGNTPDLPGNFVLLTEKFSGTGACTQFTLARNISDANVVVVVVNGIVQTPSYSFSVTNGLLTFTEAPSADYADNITVTHLASSIITYNNINAGQLLPGSVTETALATGAVTETKLANFVIKADKIGLNQITGNLIATNQITGNQIAINSISTNNFSSAANAKITGSGLVGSIIFGG
jgi:hypothetical protein